MSDLIKVLLVDDHPVVRTGYRHLLETDPDIRVIAEASDASSAYDAFRSLVPDIVVMDISLPGVSGIEAMKRMRAHRPQARILIFSMHNESIFVSRAMRAGAAGFVGKSSAPENLIDAVRSIARGQSYVANERSEDSLTIPGAPSSDLSNREAEVLRLWSQGLSLHDIGMRLGVSEKTVANYQSLVRQKLGVQNDVQLVRVAEQMWSVPY